MFPEKIRWEGEFTFRSDSWAGLIASWGSFYPMTQKKVETMPRDVYQLTLDIASKGNSSDKRSVLADLTCRCWVSRLLHLNHERPTTGQPGTLLLSNELDLNMKYEVYAWPAIMIVTPPEDNHRGARRIHFYNLLSQHVRAKSCKRYQKALTTCWLKRLSSYFY